MYSKPPIFSFPSNYGSGSNDNQSTSNQNKNSNSNRYSPLEIESATPTSTEIADTDINNNTIKISTPSPAPGIADGSPKSYNSASHQGETPITPAPTPVKLSRSATPVSTDRKITLPAPPVLTARQTTLPVPTSGVAPSRTLVLPHQVEGSSSPPAPAAAPTSISKQFPNHFKNCQTLPQVVETAEKLAVFGLDMGAAIQAVLDSPRNIDLDIINADVQTVKAIGFTAAFGLTADRIRPKSLSTDLFVAKYPNVTTNSAMVRLSNDGLTTEGDADFMPNNGVNPALYPPTIADDRVICYHIAKGHKIGKYLILPTELFATEAAKENLQFHISPAFIVKKRDEATGRLVINYSESGPNFEAKPIQLATVLGPIKPPQYADVCRLLINAKRLFPGQEIYALRRDVDGAYNRLLYNIKSALLCAFNVSTHGKKFTAIPTSCMFGDQQVNFEFDQVSRAIAEVVAIRAHELTLSPLPLTTVCTDDIIAIGGRAFIEAIYKFIGETVGTGTIPGLLGVDAIALGKDLFGSAIEILGWQFDCYHETIAPNPLTLAKLFHLFFTSLGPAPYPGQPIPLAHLQRISAHAIRAADVVTAMLPFSRSFSNSTIGVKPHTNAYLTRTNVHDIGQWRAILTAAVDDMRVLTSPVFAPHIKKRLTPEETDTQRDARAAAHATIVAFSDAATGNGADATPLLGGFVPDHSWFHLSLPAEANEVMDLRNKKRRSDINVHEFTAIVLTALLSLNSLITSPLYANKSRHIHIWSDNTSSIFRARSNRSHLPIYSLMLTILTILQVQYQCLITVGFIKGAKNVFGDATSRNFAVPDGQTIRTLLEPLEKWQPSQNLVKLILSGCSNSVMADWHERATTIIKLELSTLQNSC